MHSTSSAPPTPPGCSSTCRWTGIRATASVRTRRACQIGVDGYQLLDAVWAATSAPYLRTLPAVEALRQIWVQQYYRCNVPEMAVVRWRTTEEQPPAAVRITSPYE